ncbi:nuclear transport factor 2 family protein [Kribbella sp. NPDC048915]|uniref:nuclear transport factor 2 family protein n=1 Tax=Kribbella sp. NPDC048915 TaxID=3155148 RepID=UPI0033D1B856
MPQSAELDALERTRLAHLVARRIDAADAIHAPDFVIVTPSGHAWTKAEYLGGIASGDINYRRFEPIGAIDVMVDGGLAVLRYRSAIEVGVNGREPAPLSAWHLDCYRRTADGWQIRWSQATALT